MKPDNVHIKTITSNDGTIYGLGDNDTIYRWDAGQHMWRLQAVARTAMVQ